MNDPIVDEVRRARDAHAARFNYDLDAIYKDIKEQEKKSGLAFAPVVPATEEPKPATQPSQAAPPISRDPTSPEAVPVAEIRR